LPAVEIVERGIVEFDYDAWKEGFEFLFIVSGTAEIAIDDPMVLPFEYRGMIEVIVFREFHEVLRRKMIIGINNFDQGR